MKTQSNSTTFLADLFLYVDSDADIAHVTGRVVLLLIIALWSIKFISAPIESNYAMNSFLHVINLFIHEAGHVFFRPLGRFMMMLGGSLMQLIMPLLFFLTFLIKYRDTFAASVTLWWLGESLMDLAPYINDARALKLTLLGGYTGKAARDIHDWEFILHKLGWLQYDHILAILANGLGIFLMLCTFVWGGYVLFKQFKTLKQMGI